MTIEKRYDFVFYLMCKMAIPMATLTQETCRVSTRKPVKVW
nr:hypothetical protein [Eikenella corrodens]